MTKRILVVDDEAPDLETIKILLEGEGYEVVTATNGAEGLDALTKEGFALILIDIQMPTLSGYDLLRLLRERINHHAKMVYISIVPKKEVSMENIDGFIQKPIDKEDLLEEVKRVLG